jgi:hypothetical protein
MSWSAEEGDEATITISTVSVGSERICAVMYRDSMCCMKPPNAERFSRDCDANEQFQCRFEHDLAV